MSGSRNNELSRHSREFTEMDGMIRVKEKSRKAAAYTAPKAKEEREVIRLPLNF